MEPSEYVTAHEAAEITGLGYTTIRRRIRDGLLRAVLVKPNRYAIRRADLPGYHPSLQAQIRDLSARVDVLEAQGRGRIIPETPPRPPVAPLTHAYDGSGLPSSWWARVEWVARLTGRSAQTVRSWPQVREWSTTEDALAWLRDRKGVTVDIPTPASLTRHD